MLETVSNLLDKNNRVNLYINGKSDATEKKVNEIANKFNLPIKIINASSVSMLGLLAEVKKNSNDSIIYLIRLDNCNSIKQSLITPFLDNRSNRENSILVIGVENELNICKPVMERMDIKLNSEQEIKEDE